MADERPQADRILVAQLTGEARHRARWRELSSDEEAAAVAELQALAGGRPDLRLRGGYSGERGDDGPRRGKPPRRNRLLRGAERVHDPQSRRCGVSAISKSEA